MKKFDYIVIGSGIAGLVYALESAKKGTVAIITKKSLRDCNTDYAQGGIAAVLDEHDSYEEHIHDTFIAGGELGKKEVIETIVKLGPQLIQYLIDLGTKFTTEDPKQDKSLENLSLAREGGHSHSRIAFGADSTGHHIMDALIANCQAHSNISIFENHMAVDLITQHHILQTKGFVPGIACWGAYILNIVTNEIEIFRSHKTMLATGGASQVYALNTNPDIATGDGMAMARLAGARLVNMEFVQFHPTAFYQLGVKPFLVSEAVRGEGAILRLQDGSSFMERYHPLGNLAPRDVVSRAIDAELKKRGDKFLFLDATGLDANHLRKRFPYIDKKCKKNGIDFTTQPIPIAPAAHYFCGGILSTIDGQTDIKNLLAAGEVACTGLHGANRLASNSLLEALVVAYRAGNHPSNADKTDFPDIPEWQDLGTYNENEWVIISHNRETLGAIMQGYVGIRRTRRLLKYALSHVENIYNEINNFYNHNSVSKEVIETRNLAIIALMIIRSAISRKESRGAHYVVDYPNRDDLHFNKDTII